MKFFLFTTVIISENNFGFRRFWRLFSQFYQNIPRFRKKTGCTKRYIPFSYYSLRNASMGLRFAAFIAGSNPKTIPITMENTTLITIAGAEIATGI